MGEGVWLGQGRGLERPGEWVASVRSGRRQRQRNE
jgi:hypothetical protein